MMKRLFTLIAGIFLLCSTMLAGEDIKITLDKYDSEEVSRVFPYGVLSFKLEDNGLQQRLIVSLKNYTGSSALLIFRNIIYEKPLKNRKPKVEFEKTYPGKKGQRNVSGCSELIKSSILVLPSGNQELIKYDVASPAVVNLRLPIYLATYDAKKLANKGADNIGYKIFADDILNLNIEITGWNEKDPEYLSTKGAVERYLSSVKRQAFCNNPRHDPPLAVQQEPFKNAKDSLITVIENIVETNGWMTDQAPYKAYKALRTQLENVNLDKYNHDCGEHNKHNNRNNRNNRNNNQPNPNPAPISGVHSCGYCALSSQQIFHQLDDLYKKLSNGKISKAAALKQAQGLNKCYQDNTKRTKNDSYSGKIAGLYNRIAGY